MGIVPEEWNETSFSTLFTSTSEYTDDLDKYPLYSLTIEDGVTPKTERYERSHLVKKEDSYKIVRPNDYAYNPMNLRFGSVARHKGNLPVAVSGYYDIFTTVHKSDLPFMDSFLTCDPKFLFFKFQSINWNKYDESSGVPSLNASTIGSVDIFAPEFPEQTAIAEVLSAADREIDLLRQDIEQEKQKKKALMQLLLTGIVRVKT